MVSSASDKWSTVLAKWYWRGLSCLWIGVAFTGLRQIPFDFKLSPNTCAVLSSILYRPPLLVGIIELETKRSSLRQHIRICPLCIYLIGLPYLMRLPYARHGFYFGDNMLLLKASTTHIGWTTKHCKLLLMDVKFDVNFAHDSHGCMEYFF